MSIKPVSTTMGVSTPATLAEGTHDYTYRGKKPYLGPDNSRQLTQNAEGLAARRKRIAEYCELRSEGKSRTEAGAGIGICDSTSKAYEAVFQDRQRGESGP